MERIADFTDATLIMSGVAICAEQVLLGLPLLA